MCVYVHRLGILHCMSGMAYYAFGQGELGFMMDCDSRA